MAMKLKEPAFFFAPRYSRANLRLIFEFFGKGDKRCPTKLKQRNKRLLTQPLSF